MTLSPKVTRSTYRRSRWRGAFAVAAMCAALSLMADGGAQASGNAVSFKVVVHPANPVTSLRADVVRQVFLKQRVRWDDGEAIKPVDLAFQSEVRAEFSSEVLARSVQAVRSYWLQRIFSGGHVPPPELHSDQAVIDYVASNRGAVGYVSAGADASRVKVVQVR